MALTHEYEITGANPEPEASGGPDMTVAGTTTSTGYGGGVARIGTSAADRMFVSDHSWPIYNPGTNPFTWRAFIKIDAVYTLRRGLATYWEDIGGNNRGWGLFVVKNGAASHENEIYITVSADGSSVYAASYGPNIVGAGWKVLHVVRSGTSMIGYVNAVSSMVMSCPSSIYSGSTFAYVLGSGGFPWGRDGAVDCNIDKIACWNTALSPAEVNSDYLSLIGSSWTNPPTRVSERGAAGRPRYIYISSLSKGYLVYSATISANNHFFVKEYPGTTGTWIVDAEVGIVDWFDISLSGTTNVVVFTYSRANKIYKMEVNFSTRAIVSQPTEVFVGHSPALTRESPPRIDYIKNDNLQYRDAVSSGETEHEVGDPPDRLFLQVSADMHYNSQKMRFAAQMMPAQDVALPFSDIANTILFYDGQTTLSSPRRLEDLSSNNYHLPIDVLIIDTTLGLRFNTSYIPQVTWTVPSTALYIEAWVVPIFLNDKAYLIGGSDLNLIYKNDGTLEFSFTGTSYNRLIQTLNDVIVQSGQLNHISVAHTWGSSDTILTINGSQVATRWDTGFGGSITGVANNGGGLARVTTSSAHGLSNGDGVEIIGTTNYDGTYNVFNVTATTFDVNDTFAGSETGSWKAGHGVEDPSLGSITSDVLLGREDYLHSMRILSVVRSASQTRSYVDGKSL
jgi:hypothetical protein